MGTEDNKKSEGEVVNYTQQPNTITTLKRDLEAIGIRPGLVLIVHSSLSKIGWTVGGPVALIRALMEILTDEGTLVMPTFSGDNSDPSYWENPPVPKAWWEIIRNEMPAFHPDITPTRGMGSVIETFRKWPNVHRSNHPMSSFAAWGKHAEFITRNHELEADLGENSPLARIYDLDGLILLIGVSHENNSSLHFAEYRSNFANKKFRLTGSAIYVKSKRKWVKWQELELNVDDFELLGAEFESKINYTPGNIGLAESRLLSQREMVDFGIKWFKKNR